MAVHPDGRLTLVAVSGSFRDPPDLWIARLDPDGSLRSQFGLGRPGVEDGPAVVAGADGRTYVSAISCETPPINGDAWIAALNDDGTVAWQKTVGADGWDGAHVAAADPEGLLLVGQTDNSDSRDCAAWILRLAYSGELLWQKALSSGGCDAATGAFAMDAGGWVVAGRANPGDILPNRTWIGALGSDCVLGEPLFLHGRSNSLLAAVVMPLGADVIVVAWENGGPADPVDTVVARLGLPPDFFACGLLESFPLAEPALHTVAADTYASPYPTDGSTADAAVSFRDEPAPVETLCDG